MSPRRELDLLLRLCKQALLHHVLWRHRRTLLVLLLPIRVRWRHPKLLLGGLVMLLLWLLMPWWPSLHVLDRRHQVLL